jgi:hypothetical protein
MAITFTTETFNTETKKYDRETKTIAVGATLDTWGGSIRVMFDEWASTTFASYWDEDAQCIKQVAEVFNVTVDATPEVMAKVNNFIFEREYEKALSEAQNEAARVTKDSIVKVARGRSSKGVEGKVVVTMQKPYQTGYRANLELKLGIATSDVKVKVAAANGKIYDNYRDMVWVWARNCDLVEVPEINLEEVKERAANATEWIVRSYKAKA